MVFTAYGHKWRNILIVLRRDALTFRRGMAKGIGFNLLEGVSRLMLLRSLGRVRGNTSIAAGLCAGVLISSRSGSSNVARLPEISIGDLRAVRDFALLIPDQIHLNFRRRMESHLGT